MKRELAEDHYGLMNYIYNIGFSFLQEQRTTERINELISLVIFSILIYQLNSELQVSSQPPLRGFACGI
ncbi:MAG: hypothetical protein BGO78_06445 [Chloroflexi bacterium 44-23]|nr:MAG: hypothetical protein BGO78_06445 [Chloroflexi bacterium 44-23]